MPLYVNTILIDSEIPSGTIDGANTYFGTLYTYKTGTLKVYLNGFRLKKGATDDFTETANNQFHMAIAPATGDTVMIDYQKL